ncbi:hypothetical protein QJS10_CPB17g00211 [Acorus calamus]|uniref:Uncharacterized protein n=1 Tax=Acorus calamus TaxID=4465 RepID=A0AAV9CZB1_ACOCL|nr:hypothetical protein QJS10_CPB17g00211 [Acorus calamus]
MLMVLLGEVLEAKMFEGLSWRISEILNRASDLGFLRTSSSLFLERLKHMMEGVREVSPGSSLVPLGNPVQDAKTSKMKISPRRGSRELQNLLRYELGWGSKEPTGSLLKDTLKWILRLPRDPAPHYTALQTMGMWIGYMNS